MFGRDAVDAHWGAQLKVRVPSDTTLRRARLLLDASFCVHMAERFKSLLVDDGVLFLWMDSSPQARVDWLLSMAVVLPGSQLHSAVTSSHALTTSVHTFMEAFENGDQEKMEQVVLQRHECGPQHTVRP